MQLLSSCYPRAGTVPFVCACANRVPLRQRAVARGPSDQLLDSARHLFGTVGASTHAVLDQAERSGFLVSFPYQVLIAFSALFPLPSVVAGRRPLCCREAASAACPGRARSLPFACPYVYLAAARSREERRCERSGTRPRRLISAGKSNLCHIKHQGSCRQSQNQV